MSSPSLGDILISLRSGGDGGGRTTLDAELSPAVDLLAAIGPSDLLEAAGLSQVEPPIPVAHLPVGTLESFSPRKA
jgi:hypothetical protein